MCHVAIRSLPTSLGFLWPPSPTIKFQGGSPVDPFFEPSTSQKLLIVISASLIERMSATSCLGMIRLRPDGAPPRINIFAEKHACLLAGLTWTPEASDTGRKAEYIDPRAGSSRPEPLPTINIFELWEDGSEQAKAKSSRAFH